MTFFVFFVFFVNITTTFFQLAEEREKTFAKMDENGDGSIAFNEWLAFFLQVVKIGEFFTTKLFSFPQEIIAPVAAL